VVVHRIDRMKACLNGSRRRREHPAVPVTAAELAVAGVDAVAAGAEALHLHPRDGDGRQSLHPDDVGDMLASVRWRCPDVPIGVTTGLWITKGDVERRLKLVARWAELPAATRPDFASVNVSEPGFADLVEVLNHVGIDIEVGVWSASDAQTLAAHGPVSWTRILVEIVGTPAEQAVVAADAVLSRLDELGVVGPRLLHGETHACWPLIAHAGRLGLPTRVGLEDTLVGPAGESISGNADLVQRALQVWSAASAQR
jgi:uncharacterized protein (DUF849 family)